MNPDIFTPLAQLFALMDKSYETTAAAYGFVCRGCEDNCCRSLFFHHTFVEKQYLLHGFEKMAPEMKNQILKRAKAYVEQTFPRAGEPYPHSIESMKLLCPLNEAGQCTLYPFRPMICRLHGLPHELHRPGHPPAKNPGCDAGQFDQKPYHPFDRTPLYKAMAQVERSFKQNTGQTGKIKQTIAQMLYDKDLWPIQT